ncbi:hypothetical protein [Streptomyces sp. NPDC046939]|uniref:hypothetical protein n=1 Tax=Streptomyces sp. NPDC046939 TaxID=3155376 RepID=UPI0033CD7316
MMLTLQSTSLVLDKEVVEGLMVPSEAPVSDAPIPSVEDAAGGSGGGALLLGLGLLLSPKEPKEPKGR